MPVQILHPLAVRIEYNANDKNEFCVGLILLFLPESVVTGN